MTPDNELLSRYANERSEQAFAELVQLRLGFVYSAALRRVGGDAHLANDVTQQVFVALAREAGRLARHPVLTGWLYTTTRNLAAQIVRTERRRRTREKEASAMHEIDPTGRLAPDWQKLRDNLDSALDELDDRDRSAVLLRFFEQYSFAEIGAQLKLTENAARMRVERALDKMHAILSTRGVSSTASALAPVLAAQAAQIVPTGLAAAATGTALTSASLSASALGLTFMSMTKLKLGIAITLVAAGIGGLVIQEHTNAQLRRQISSLTQKNEALEKLQEENVRLRQTASVSQPAATNPTSPVATESPATHDIVHAKSRLEREPVALAPGLTPVGKLDHSGRSTARGAFSTQLWAAAQGDVELEQSTITLQPAAHAKLEALLATLPEAVRSNYGTPERLMASVLAGSPHPVGGMQILGETTQTSDSIILQTAWQHADDDIVHHSKVELQRDNDGWRLVVPMILTDRAATYLKGNAVIVPSREKK